MKKVVFCEIAWMKNYSGVNEDDKPKNGGKYIDENSDGGEVYNFLSYNHKLYGFVMHYGEELHIERYDKMSKNLTEIDDVTVVWVASDGISSRIVGWYENATMFRYWQYLSDYIFFEDRPYREYNFLADEKNCYLIPEEDRTFIVPRAPKAGKGRGMGQSNVWYADSEYAQNEFIPKVLEYLESVKDKTHLFFWNNEEITHCAEDTEMTAKELLEKAGEIFESGGPFNEEISYLNLAVKKDDCFETRSRRATVLAQMGMYDEAEEDYKRALFYKDDINVTAEMMYTEMMLNHNFMAIELGEKVRSRKGEDEYWFETAMYLASLYYDEGKYNLAHDLINECKSEEGSERHKWIDDFERMMIENSNM